MIEGAQSERAILELERPDEALMTYYVLVSFLAGPFFFVPLTLLYFRYHTLRYRFDEEGISMRWGVLFRREIHLTYARIQDIHLVSNVVERWLGLARIQVQTASGSAKAEMTIEGIREFAALRDFLYSRMRGARDPQAPPASRVPDPQAGASGDELTATLRAVADELAALRRELAARPAGPPGGERAAAGTPDA